MSSRSFVAALVGAILLPAAAHAAVLKPFTRVHPPCGSAANHFFCKGMPFSTQTVQISAFAVTFPGTGFATVSWTGTVFCSLVSADGDLNYRVDFQLRTDGNKPVVNAQGSMSIGYRETDVLTNTPDHTQQVPVNVMRAFRIAAAGTQTFRLTAYADGLAGSASFCNFNGGEMIVTFIPD